MRVHIDLANDLIGQEEVRGGALHPYLSGKHINSSRKDEPSSNINAIGFRYDGVLGKDSCQRQAAIALWARKEKNTEQIAI